LLSPSEVASLRSLPSVVVRKCQSCDFVILLSPSEVASLRSLPSVVVRKCQSCDFVILLSPRKVRGGRGGVMYVLKRELIPRQLAVG